MKKITIIGAGQLGSRHLQALNLLDSALDIRVIDPNESSLNIARSRFEASIQNTEHSIHYLKTMALEEDAIDVAIIASTAKMRRSIIENLMACTTVKHLVLEKLLFAQRQDYEDMGKLLGSLDTKTWVNCPMRMMPFYHNLKPLFDKQAIHYRVTGSQFGLITNAIHYLDHITHMTGDNTFSLDLSYLDTKVIESKRPGYFELTGTLIAKYANGSMAILHCDKQGSAPVQIEIYNHEHRIISKEWEQKAWQTSQNADWQWQEREAAIPFQSSLTAQLVKSLIETNHCKLPDYETSAKTHLQLLEPLQNYLQDAQIKTNLDFPFT